MKINGMLHVNSLGSVVLLLTLIGCGPGVSDLPRPDTPRDVAAIARNQTIEIKWTPVSGVEPEGHYNVYWAKSPGVTPQNGVKVESNTSQFIHTNESPLGGETLKNGDAYYYAVTAVTYTGESAPSVEISAAPQPPPPPPKTVTATEGDKSITLTWSPVPEAQSYTVYMATEDGVTPENYKALKGGMRFQYVTSPYEQTGLINRGKYYFVVTATNESGEGTMSDRVSKHAGFSFPRISSNCVLKFDDSLWCWGYKQPVPVRVGMDSSWSVVDVGEEACAVKTDSSLWCWGSTLVRVGTDSDWSVVAAGKGTCALKTDSSLWCWGGIFGWLLDDGGNGGLQTSTPMRVGTDFDWSAVTVGGGHACALKTDSSLWCWGSNYFGELGDGSNGDVVTSTPVRVGMDSSWSAVAAGGGHTCAVKTDSSLWCWGNNYWGQLGVGTTGFPKRTPVRVGTDSDWSVVTAGSSWHTCALKTDSSLWCWGNNDYGKLGNGTQISTSTPVRVGTGSDWDMVVAGTWHTCALKTDSSLWCWGSNYYGDLGLGNGTVECWVPVHVDIGADPSWSVVAEGNNHTCVLGIQKTDLVLGKQYLQSVGYW